MSAIFVPVPQFRSKPNKVWINGVNQPANTSTISFGNFTAPADGLLVALITCVGGQDRTTSSVSIGGSAATLHATHGASSFFKAAIASRYVSAGAHNVTITLSGANGDASRNFCGCWLLTNYKSATPTSALYNRASLSATITITHNLPAYSVAFYQSCETGSEPTFTNAVIDGSATDGGSGGRSYWASRIISNASAGYIETSTYGGVGDNVYMNGATWV